MQKTIITVKGTHCKACKMLIEDVCKETAGVASCSVDFTNGRTEIEHEGLINWNALKEEIEKLGEYSVEFNQV